MGTKQYTYPESNLPPSIEELTAYTDGASCEFTAGMGGLYRILLADLSSYLLDLCDLLA